MTDLYSNHIRTVIPAEWARRLSYLATDSGRTRMELIREGVLLLLHHHGRGEGLPDPIQAASAPTSCGGRP